MRGTHNPEVLERIAYGYEAATAKLKRCPKCGVWMLMSYCLRCIANHRADARKVAAILTRQGYEPRRLRGKAGLRQRARRRKAA